MVRQQLKKEEYDVVLIGAGIRGPPSNFPLFEVLMNITCLELVDVHTFIISKTWFYFCISVMSHESIIKGYRPCRRPLNLKYRRATHFNQTPEKNENEFWNCYLAMLGRVAKPIFTKSMSRLVFPSMRVCA